MSTELKPKLREMYVDGDGRLTDIAICPVKPADCVGTRCAAFKPTRCGPRGGVTRGVCGMANP